MQTKEHREPDAFAHSSAYLALRRLVRRHAPYLLGPWAEFQRVIWSIRYRTAESRFKAIHKTNYWANAESLSGWGSTLEATSRTREALVAFVQEHGVRSLLDVPCGDFI